MPRVVAPSIEPPSYENRNQLHRINPFHPTLYYCPCYNFIAFVPGSSCTSQKHTISINMASTSLCRNSAWESSATVNDPGMKQRRPCCDSKNMPHACYLSPKAKHPRYIASCLEEIACRNCTSDCHRGMTREQICSLTSFTNIQVTRWP